MPTKHNTKNTKTRSQLATEKLTEARSLLATREAAQETAEETAADLIARLTRGDERVTALDLVTAEAEITRLGYLIEHAKLAIPAAERELDNASAIDSPALARFIVERIEADPFAFGVYGMPVVINGDDRSKPGVYVNQASATITDPATGIMSGRVGLTVVTPNGSPVDGAAMLSGLAGIEASGAALVDSSASPSPAGVTIDVRLSNLKPSAPALPAEVDNNHLRNFALDLINDISARGGQFTPRGSGMYGGSGLYDITVNNISHALADVSVAKQEHDGDQERRTVRVEFDLGSWKFRAEEIAEYTRTSLGDLVGEMAAGIGRVRAARVVSEKATTESGKPGQEFSNARNVAVRVVVEVEAVALIVV